MLFEPLKQINRLCVPRECDVFTEFLLADCHLCFTLYFKLSSFSRV